MRIWERFLKVDIWTREYESVDRFLRHNSRKMKSEKTRENICFTLKGLCEFAKESPDDLSRHTPKASKLLQEYIDSLAEKRYSTRHMNVCLAFLKTFFKVNGFKGTRGGWDIVKELSEDKFLMQKDFDESASGPDVR